MTSAARRPEPRHKQQHRVIASAMTRVGANSAENGFHSLRQQMPGQSCSPTLGSLGDAQSKIGRRYSAPEQVLEEAPKMRRGCLIAIRRLAGHKMLHEADSIGGAKARQIDHRGSKAMVEESIGEAQRVIDRARAQATLLEQVGLKVGHQYRTRDLRFGQRHGRRHADVDQVLGEPPSEMVEADGGVASSPYRSRQLVRKIGGQCRRRYSGCIHQPSQLFHKMTVGSDCSGRVVRGRKAPRERF
ncbi:MAG: hypothetical protein WBO09_07585 [Methylocystis silviterrae]|uniref:hypothetical protein n=1 Tax=Methylocystis silviterrae TaxID=2743612 RepID=UPI003C741DB3